MRPLTEPHRRPVERRKEPRESEEAQKAREAALRAAEEARARKGRDKFYHDRIDPLLFLARINSELPPFIEQWGISLDRPEEEVLNDPIREEYHSRLTRSETTDTIRAMTKRWISRIAEDLPALKPMRSIWIALTGGNNTEAAIALKGAVTAHPDLSKPLKPTIDDHEARHAPPEPEPPSSGFSGPSM